MMCVKILFCYILFATGFSLCYGNGLTVYNNISDGEYNSMPKLFHLDRFDACIESTPNLYCDIAIQLIPIDTQKPSKTWKIIQAVISLPRNYRHDRLRHGICIPKSCPKISNDHYAVGNGTEELWKGISECYTEKYESMGLKAALISTHCENEDPFYKIDTLDIVYGVCMLSLLAVTILATTIYWLVTRNANQKELNHVASTLYRIVKAFSFISNWDKLRAESLTEESKMFAPIQGIRVYNLLWIIASHSILTRLCKPVLNPKYVEDATIQIGTMLFANGSFVLQTSFCISGWLLSYGLCVVFENKKIQLKEIMLIFVNRYLRIAPLLLLVIGFETTWMRHLVRGPVVQSSMGDEYRNCRNNWLWSILFINNYHKVPEICLQQSWYLSVDMQGFVVGLFIMALIINNRQHMKMIFAVSIAFFLSVSFAHHYYMEYDIQLRAYAENLYTLYLEDKNFVNYFVAGHVSAASYIQGLVYGYYFYKLKKEKKSLMTSTVAKVGWTIFVWTVPTLIILMGGFYYREGSEYTRFEAALYQSLSRYIFAVAIGSLIFGMSFGIGGPMVALCNWAPLQILARSTYSIYLIHTIHQRIRSGIVRTPFYLTNYLLVLDALGDMTISFILGILVCVLVEMPISELQKVFLAQRQKLLIDDVIKEKTE